MEKPNHMKRYTVEVDIFTNKQTFEGVTDWTVNEFGRLVVVLDNRKRKVVFNKGEWRKIDSREED